MKVDINRNLVLLHFSTGESNVQFFVSFNIFKINVNNDKKQLEWKKVIDKYELEC